MIRQAVPKARCALPDELGLGFGFVNYYIIMQLRLAVCGQDNLQGLQTLRKQHFLLHLFAPVEDLHVRAQLDHRGCPARGRRLVLELAVNDGHSSHAWGGCGLCVLEG